LNLRLIVLIASFLSCNLVAAQEIPAQVKDMVSCLTPEQQQAFAKRVLDAVAQVAISATKPHAARFREAQAASDQARAAYIGCIKAAKAADKAPAEECIGAKKAFDDREAELKSPISEAEQQRIAAAMEPEFIRAAEKVLVEFPRCEKQK
jgi:hypothetical protein